MHLEGKPNAEPGGSLGMAARRVRLFRMFRSERTHRWRAT